jgi:hypothetical protein
MSRDIVGISRVVWNCAPQVIVTYYFQYINSFHKIEFPLCVSEKR